jgi:hypothetical protein
MFGIAMIGRDAFFIALFMTDNIGHRIEAVLLTEISEQLDRGLIGTLNLSLSLIEIATSKRGSAGILDTIRLGHFDADMSIISGSSGVPSSEIPG